MKKIIIILIFLLASFHGVFAYTPTTSEEKLLGKIENILEVKAKIKWEFWLRQQIIAFEKMKVKVALDERKSYLIGAIVQILNDIKNWVSDDNVLVEQEDVQTEEDVEISNTDSKSKMQAFFDSHGKQITTWLDVSESCTKYFDFVDEIAKKNDFPTELIIATWGIEYGCKLWNPANGWGPFQITSQYYTPWDITLEEFGNAVQKYIEFTRGKWDYFNNNAYHNYKERFWSENINVTYDNYTLRDLKLTAILYNGVSKDTTLDGNTFANANLNENVSHKSDGVVTRFLKVLNWKIINK